MLYRIQSLCRSGVATLLLFVCAPAFTSFAAGPGRGGADVIDGINLYQVGKAGNLCAITFDDGPSRHTDRLLDVLRVRGIRATFFMLGKAAERNPQTVRRVQEEGHELANHTYSHKNLRHMPYADQLAEIERVQAVLAAQGATSRFLRPPFGRYDPNTVKIVDKLGLKIALWSVDSHDWQHRATVEQLESVYGKNAQNGIMLFHDTHEQTVDAMPEILDALMAAQCRFVTVSEFMEYAENPALLEALPVQNMPSPDQPAVPAGLEPAAALEPSPDEPTPSGMATPSTANSLQPESANIFADTFRQLGNWAQGLMGQGI